MSYKKDTIKLLVLLSIGSEVVMVDVDGVFSGFAAGVMEAKDPSAHVDIGVDVFEDKRLRS